MMLSQRFVRVPKRVAYTATWKHNIESQLVCKIAAVVNFVGSAKYVTLYSLNTNAIIGVTAWLYHSE
jgi:hypothetical protein